MESGRPILRVEPAPYTAADATIGMYLASLAEEGSTIRLGIGNIIGIKVPAENDAGEEQMQKIEQALRILLRSGLQKEAAAPPQVPGKNL